MDDIYNKPLKYKEICDIMNEPISTSGSKGRQLQLAKWQQFYDIDKIGTKYYIKKKYSTEELNLIECSGKYASYIADKLLYYFDLMQRTELTISYYDIYEITNMVNINYHVGKNNIYTDRTKEIIKFDTIEDNILELSKDDIIFSSLNSFFEISNKLLKQNVDNAIKSMAQKGLITYNESFILYKKPIKQGDIYVSQPKHICNVDEISTMLDIKNESLNRLGLSKKQLYFAPRIIKKEYHDYILDKVKETFGYDYYTNAIHFIVGKKSVKHELKFHKSNKINKNIQTQMLESKEISKKITAYLNKQFVKEYIDNLGGKNEHQTIM